MLYQVGWALLGFRRRFKSHTPCINPLLCNRFPWTCGSNFTSTSSERKGQEAAARGDMIRHVSLPLDTSPPSASLPLFFSLPQFYLPQKIQRLPPVGVGKLWPSCWSSSSALLHAAKMPFEKTVMEVALVEYQFCQCYKPTGLH